MIEFLPGQKRHDETDPALRYRNYKRDRQCKTQHKSFSSLIGSGIYAAHLAKSKMRQPIVASLRSETPA